MKGLSKNKDLTLEKIEEMAVTADSDLYTVYDGIDY